MNLTNEQVLSEFELFLTSDSCKWSRGLSLLSALSGRYGGMLKEQIYTDGIRKIVSIKPAIAGREELFFPDKFIIPLAKIKEIAADVTKDMSVGLIENVNVPSFGLNATMYYAVPTINTVEDFSQQVAELLGERLGILKEGERILTFGSCFAVNVGRALRDQGRSVYTLLITEDVNSTCNNLAVLQKVFLGADSRVSRELGTIKGIDYKRIRDEFAAATDIIFTLGNIYHFEVEGESTLSNKRAPELVAETVSETFLYLRKIFQLLARFTKGRILVSVSPIPISGYRGLAFQSAIEADCVSKSQLRACLHEVLKDFPAATYIPTFEIFRWLPAHQSFASFGTEDGSPRHLAQEHLTKVMGAIC